jgi:AraC family transcriptional regulator
MLAGLVELSAFHFSRVFKQTTVLSPLQFVTRERITRAQQLIRAVTRNAAKGEAGLSNAKQRPGFQTTRSLIEIALDVGYTSPSHFA